MVENESGHAGNEPQDMPKALLIPPDLAQTVIDYIGTLDEDEVTGQIFRTFVSRYGTLSTQESTVKNCKDTNNGKDTICDSDVLVIRQ